MKIAVVIAAVATVASAYPAAAQPEAVDLGRGVIVAQARDSANRIGSERDEIRRVRRVGPSTRSSITPDERDFSLQRHQQEQGALQRQQLQLQIR
jgi:hypothetical protein